MKKMVLALTVFCILSSAIVIHADGTEDQIDRCIEKSNPVRLSNLFTTKFLLRQADKDSYLTSAKAVADKMQANLKQTLAPFEGLRIVGGTLAITLTALGLWCDWRNRNNVGGGSDPSPMEQGISLAMAAITVVVGTDQIKKGLTKYDRTQQLIKALAVKGVIESSSVTNR
jgi:hypothetical protein